MRGRTRVLDLRLDDLDGVLLRRGSNYDWYFAILGISIAGVGRFLEVGRSVGLALHPV